MILVNSGFDNDNNKYKVRPLITSSVTPDDVTLVADDKLLAQVFINIIKNSIEAFGKCEEDKLYLIECRQESGWQGSIND